MTLPDYLLLVLLLPWACLVWCPAYTHTLWLGGLLARETAHFGAVITPFWLALGIGAGAPAGLAPAIGTLGILLAWPLLASLASPRARPDLSRWPGAATGSAHVRRALRVSALRLMPALNARGIRVTTHRYRATPVPLHLDHYRSAAPGAGARSWLLVVHGGAWRSGSRRENASFNRALARLGVDVLAVDYRLAPTWRYPDPLEDLAEALAWIQDQAPHLGLDPMAGHLLGRSAGGQLALRLAYGPAGGRLRLVVAIYAPADMVHAGTAPFNPRLLDARAVLQDYLGATWAESPQVYAAASPLLAVRPGLPPTLLLHGVDDALVGIEHTRRLEHALAQAKVPVATGIFPWMQHGADVLGIGPSAWLCLRAVTTAIARVSPGAFAAPGSAGLLA